MPEYNHIVVIGHLGSEPEMRFTPNGRPVTSFSLASNRSYTTNDGEKKQETEWFTAVCWGRLAETTNQFLRKGILVLVDGRIHLHQWENTQNGQIMSRLQLNANRVVFLEKAERDTGYDLPEDIDNGYIPENDYIPDIEPDDIPF